MKKRTRKGIQVLGVFALIAVTFLVVIIFLAKSDINTSKVGSFEYKAKAFSKSFLMTSYGVFTNYTNEHYGPQPLDEDFKWEDLNHSYYGKIRNDKRISAFYTKENYELEDYLAMKDFLRGSVIRNGATKGNYLNTNLIKMLDAGDKGERLLCGNLSKMLAQMIMATGTQARLVRISDSRQNGHVVLEYWSKALKKWVLLDTDYNVHYSNLDSIPLGALELYLKSEASEPIIKYHGKAVNTPSDTGTKLYDNFYKLGVGIDFYNKWISKNLARTNPQRSPVNSCIYIGTQASMQQFFYQDYNITNQKIIDLINSPPSMLN